MKKNTTKNIFFKSFLEKIRKIRALKVLPNIVTCLRIGLSVYSAISFISGNFLQAIGGYAIAGVTDFVDGALARGLDAQSELGRKLDAVSDKVYAASFVIPALVAKNYMMLIPLFFEGAIAGINLAGHALGFKPETQRIGKIKTFALFPTMIVGLLSTLPYELSLPLGFAIKPWEMTLLMGPLMIATTSLQYNSMITYLNLLNRNINPEVNDNMDSALLNNEVVELVEPDKTQKKTSTSDNHPKQFAFIHKAADAATCITAEFMTSVYFQTPLEKESGISTSQHITNTAANVKRLIRERRK